MKTIRPFTSIHSPAALPALLTAVLGLASAAFAAEPEASAEPKTYSLFMGADFSVSHDKEMYRVMNIAGHSFVIKINGKETKVPMEGATVNMQIAKSLKLTERNATVANFKSERSYTPANNPSRVINQNFLDASLSNAAANSQREVLESQVRNLEALTSTSAMTYNGASITKELADARSSLRSVNAGAGSNYYVPTLPDSDGSQFDAVDVSFEVSAERPLRNPYVVIIAKYVDPNDTQPGAFRNWIYAHSLDDIGREPRKVTFKQGGFPRGFKLEECQMHLYNEREEIATTVSPKRVELTSDEAFQYVVIEYIGSHKGATLPAVPVMGKLPADLSARLAEGEFKQTYFVKVSESGQTGEIYLDKSCTQRVENPYLDSVVKKIRFKPALLKGRAIEGVGQLNLSELSI